MDQEEQVVAARDLDIMEPLPPWAHNPHGAPGSIEEVAEGYGVRAERTSDSGPGGGWPTYTFVGGRSDVVRFLTGIGYSVDDVPLEEVTA